MQELGGQLWALRAAPLPGMPGWVRARPAASGSDPGGVGAGTRHAARSPGKALVSPAVVQQASSRGSR